MSRRRATLNRVQESVVDPPMILPRVQSEPACLAQYRRGLIDLVENIEGAREMSRATRDALWQEMQRSILWLLGRLMSGQAGQSQVADIDAGVVLGWEPTHHEAAVLTAAVDRIDLSLRNGTHWGRRGVIAVSAECSLRLRWLVAQAEIEQERRAARSTLAVFLAFKAEAIADTVLERATKKIALTAKKTLPQIPACATIAASNHSDTEQRPARTGTGAQAIEADKTVIVDTDTAEYQEFLARPHFGVIEGGRVSIDDGDFDAFWQEVAPMVRDLGAALRVSPEDLLEMAHANVATTYLVTDGTARAAVIMTACDLALEGGKETVFVALLANEVTWPDLSRLIVSLKRASGDMGGLAVLLWGTNALPQVPTFEAVEVPSLPGTGLIWRPEVALAA